MLYRICGLLLCSGLFAAGVCLADDGAAAGLPETQTVQIPASLDGQLQPVRYWVPETAGQQQTPLLVFLHSWSGDYTQDNSKWLKQAVERDWIFLHPNFRGVNNSPQACGSRFARQDVLDAIDYACREFNVDHSRIYLAGVSGGGHMAMLMAGHHPDRFSAVSAWVGISDVADWYRFHVRDGQPQKYAAMILKCFGAAPGTSAAVDADYRDRSPVFHLHNAADLPIEISAGVRDGIAGSVPIRHSLNAFNVIATVHGTQPVSSQEIETLWTTGQLSQPQASDRIQDPVFPREILLRRFSGDARVTIFDGAHESFPVPACEWLAKQQREVSAD